MDLQKAIHLADALPVHPDIRSDYCCVLLDELRSIPGDVIELGVGIAATSKRLAKHLAWDGGTRRFFACDSFRGFPYDDDPSLDGSLTFKKGEYNTPKHHIENILSEADVTGYVDLVEGCFEDTLEQQLGNRQFAFAWVDADLYQSTLVGFNFLKSRMVPGSILGFHDYQHEHTPGVTVVVDQEVDRSIFKKIFHRETCIFFRRV